MTGIWIAAFVALWLLVIMLGLLLLGTLRRVAPLLERAEVTLRDAARATLRGLRPGEKVPPFTASEVGASVFTEADLRGSTTIVLFLDTGCTSCELLAGDLEAGRVPDLGVSLVVVTDDADEGARFAAARQARVLIQEDGSVARAFDSNRTPHAFVIGEDGRVLESGSPNDWKVMASLLRDGKEGGGRQVDVAAARAVS